jgi:hypothetical protein
MDFIFLLLSFINMSLLITSSQSKVNTNSIGIEKPERFTNHLRGALEIKPNSQIAIDSIKINRESVIDYQDDKVALFWFGERLSETRKNADDTSLDHVTSWPIVQENTISRSLGIADFQIGFRKMLREAYCYHPEINTSHSQNASLMSRNITSQSLDGFEFQFQQNTAAPVSLRPGSGQAINVFGRDPAGDYDPTNGSFLSNADDYLVLFACENASNGPISLNNGSLTFNVSQTRAGAGASTREFVVGLTRAYNHLDYQDAFQYDIGIDVDNNEGMGRDGDVFFDYCAEGKDGELKLYHFVRKYGSNDPDRLGEMREIEYYSKTAPNNGSNSSFATGSPMNVSEVTSITFNCKNEILTVNVNPGNFVLVTVNKSDDPSFADCIPKPINQACWKMYPQVYFYNASARVTIEEYDQRTGTTMDSNLFYGAGDWQARCNDNYYTGSNYEQDPNKQLTWVGSKWWPTLLEQRELFPKAETSSTPKPNFKGVNGSLMDDFENIFIVGRNDIYLRDMLQNQWQPNAARQLGMVPFTIFPPEDSVVSNVGSSFTSESQPETSSQSSAFVRLPQLSHTTYNAGKGSVSKIVGMIPRFDNAGNEKGALFFQKPDRLYVDLNNTDSINLTDITVEIVRRDETFVEDLSGGTEIVFHVREKPKM